MLNGGFMESGTGIGDWVVRLPAVGAKEVRIFLAIIHSNLAAGPVPNGMPLGQLHRMLAFADKYDVTAKIYPWAERWMEAVKSEVEDPRLLAVAWELGDVSTVDMIVKRLAYKCRADQNGNLIYRRSAYDSDEEDALKKYACDTIDGDSKQNDGSADENEDEDEGDNQYFSVIPAEALGKSRTFHGSLLTRQWVVLDFNTDVHR
ncbi:nuclear pore protein-like protein [Colletotrichum plurivorum]|uniref:Nuclear pore protein-like protein n=1 Tax=Colletotrichum plurivorum TaxID=2175906 RepID=A0A8H6JCP7_9PEZI|nr:nuclear pore protein-like protein [Colletotrichum plurivorum]